MYGVRIRVVPWRLAMPQLAAVAGAMKAYRRDVTHSEIAAGLRSIGWRVLDLASVGACIDFAVLVGDDVYLVDAKAKANSPRTDSQQALVADGWPVVFGVSAQDVADQIAARRKGAYAYRFEDGA